MSYSPKVLSSRQNDRIKFLVKLRERRIRQRYGMFLIEGLQELDCALEHGAEIDTLYFCPEAFRQDGGFDIVERTKEAGFTVQEVTKEVFEKISFAENPDGLLACAKSEDISLKSFKMPKNPLLLVLEGLEKPANLGNLLRSAEAAGVDAVVFTGEAGTDVYNPNVIRASRGLVFSLSIIVDSNEGVLEYLKEQQIRMLATTPGTDNTYWDADMKGPCALFVGSEAHGLSSFWLKNDVIEPIKIPIKGSADSLNAATAGALVLFEAMRQRR